MTVINGRTEDEVRAQVKAAGGTDQDAETVLEFQRFIAKAGPPIRLKEGLLARLTAISAELAVMNKGPYDTPEEMINDEILKLASSWESILDEQRPGWR